MARTEPLPGSEWSATYDGAPPDSLDPLIQEILGLVDSLSTGTASKNGFPIPDRARVISIFGSRGTGKSTALFFAAHALRESPDHLVLPVVDPEGFALGDSLGGWVLAALEKELSKRDLEAETDSSRGLTVGQDLENLRRAQAVRAASYLSGLGQQGLSFDDFARDAVKIPAHGVRMADRFSTLLDNLAEARANPSLRLIIPVDDADLFPELLPSIVSDAQMFGSSARVVVMFAADPKSLAQALQISYIASHESGVSVALRESLIDPQDIRELAGRKLIKYFPRSHRVQLPGMSLPERLAFKPLGDDEGEELQQVLASFPVKDGSGRSLADFFVIKTTSGELFDISPYTQSLSDNARDLRQLHDALGILAKEHPESTSKGLALIIEHGLEGLEPDLPPRASEAIRLDVSRHKERPTVSFDFRGIGFGKSLISGLMIYGRRSQSEEESEATPQDHPLSRRVMIRPLRRDYSYLENEAPPEESQRKEEDLAELPDQFTHIALLGWEAMQEGAGSAALFETTGYFRRITLAGGSNWEGFVAGDSADDEPWRYWVVPRWEEYSDYFVFEAGWNHIINLARGGLDGYQISEPTLLSVVLLVHHDLVATVHLQRAVPDWIAKLTSVSLRELINEWDERSAELKEMVGSNLEAAFVNAETGEAIRDRDYVTWFLSDLPLAASRLLVTEEMSDWLLSVWEKHASADNRRQCASKIIRMAQGHITSYMADGDLQLLERIDPDDKTAVESLRNVRAEVSERTAQRQVDVIRALQEVGVGPELIGSLQEHGVTRELVPALILAGVSPKQVTAVAEAFPATQPPQASTELKQDPTLGTPPHE